MARDKDREKKQQLRDGCINCRFAGNGTGGKLGPELTEKQSEILWRSGADWYCVYFSRPVDAAEGRSCTSFQINEPLYY